MDVKEYYSACIFLFEYLYYMVSGLSMSVIVQVIGVLIYVHPVERELWSIENCDDVGNHPGNGDVRM